MFRILALGILILAVASLVLTAIVAAAPYIVGLAVLYFLWKWITYHDMATGSDGSLP